MLSPFGEWVRAYRQKNQISLREMARTLGKTPSFLSAVELGRKSAPSNLFGMICARYRLANEEIEELQKSLENSKREVRIGKNWKNSDREVAMLFARNFEGMTAENKKKFKKLLEDDDERSEY